MILGHKEKDLDNKKCYLSYERAEYLVFPDDFLEGMIRKEVSKILINDKNVKHMMTKIDVRRIIESGMLYEYMNSDMYKEFCDQYDKAKSKHKLLARWLKALLIGEKKEKGK